MFKVNYKHFKFQYTFYICISLSVLISTILLNKADSNSDSKSSSDSFTYQATMLEGNIKDNNL